MRPPFGHKSIPEPVNPDSLGSPVRLPALYRNSVYFSA